MFLKITMFLFVFAIIASQAFAGRPPVEVFVERVHKTTGTPKEEIREEAASALRELGGRFTEEEIRLVRKGVESEFSLVRENEIVLALQNSLNFRVMTGLDAVAKTRLARGAGKAFAASMAQSLGATLELRATTAIAARYVLGAMIVAKNPEAVKLAREELAKSEKAFIRAAAGVLNKTNIFYTIIGPATQLKLKIPYSYLVDRAPDLAKYPSEARTAPEVLVDSSRINDVTIYDKSTHTIIVGTDFLRRITK